MYRDYSPRGVKFFFVYKSLAHPELVGNFVQPFTLDERLAHARQAEKQLGASIPWLVDGIDNHLKHALGDRPNSEFIIGPDGVVVRKRAWSHPAQTRKDLEQLVGRVDSITDESQIRLPIGDLLKAPAPRGPASPIDRSQMLAIVAKPQIKPDGQPFFAKLRAEVAPDLLDAGQGELYLGFHLDPLYDAHWNNLTEPLSYQLEVPEGVEIEPRTGSAPRVAAASDSAPREFSIKVTKWPADAPLRLQVKYFACEADETCHAVTQSYVLFRRQDRDAGRARGERAGFWGREEFADQAIAGDKNGDRMLTENEVQGLIRPHFTHFDTNRDGKLDRTELLSVADWLNKHHQPGAPVKSLAP